MRINLTQILLLSISAALALLSEPDCFAQASNSESKSTGFLVNRTTVENFLNDELVVGPLQKPGQDLTKLRSTFVLTSPINGQILLWNSELCRLIAVKNPKNPKYNSLLAEGPHPLANTLGTMGIPKFFGFKMSETAVVLMYTYGLISVEEKFEMAPDGRKLFQRFKVSTGAISGSFEVTPDWREILTADNGRWSNETKLTLTRDELNEGWTVTYHLDPSANR